MKPRNSFPAVALGALISGFSASPSMAASHSDAPLIKQDPQANITDVYSFVGTKYNDPATEVLNVIVHVRPFSEPGDGVIYDRFADDARYEIHITDPATGEQTLSYQFRFSSVDRGLKNKDTILSYGLGTELGPVEYVGDARQNYTQTYSVKRRAGKGVKLIGAGLLTPPPNVGLRTTPYYNDPTTGKAVSGATTIAELDSYTQETVHQLPSGEAVFAGPREDGFYADTPGIFDTLDPRILDNDGDSSDGLGQDGNGVDGFKGYNVLAYGIQIPLNQLTPAPYRAAFADLDNPDNPLPSVATATGVGVYAVVSRPRLTFRSESGGPTSFGRLVQVNRMGNPLFNEVLVPLGDKDEYNHTSPTEDSRFGDDVVDIALTALASGPDYANVTPVGDNVAENDQLYHQVFPYSATPHAGPANLKDPVN